MNLQTNRECAIQEMVRRKCAVMGLQEFEPQAQLAATNQFKREPTSAHRAVQAGVECAHRYEMRYLG